MVTSSHTTFRFRDLPREIRDKIYSNILCDFKPPPETSNSSEMLKFFRVDHSIETTILRTSKEIYQEAYQILVKTNRFVKVTSVRGIPLLFLLKSQGTPVVTEKKELVDQFPGHALAVHLGTNRLVYDDASARSLEAPVRKVYEPYTVMILGRDLDRFCKSVMDGDALRPGFSGYVKITIILAPVLRTKTSGQYAPSFETYFSEEKTQKMLLAPFKTTLRGLKDVAIGGCVDGQLSKATVDEIAQMQWPEPARIVAEISSGKEKGTCLFQAKKYDEAGLLWADVAVDIEKIIESTSWPNLVAQGGESFVPQVAEMYFLMRLNIAHVRLLSMQGANPKFYDGQLAEDSLDMAVKSLKSGFWTADYKYDPSVQHLAKLRYRNALFWRLQGRIDMGPRALTWINEALELQPGDATISRERQNIVAWLSGLT